MHSGTDDVVLISDPRVTLLPTEAIDDPLVDAEGLVPVDDRKTDPEGDWRRLRQPVLDRLQAAGQALPADLRLTLVEGYRPVRLQTLYFDRYREGLLAADPALDEDEAYRLASRYVSPPSVAPHTAGAAADITLTTPEGVELDLGCPVNASPEQSGGRCYTGHPDVTGEARLLRRELARALESTGLVNYPTEWWHWSWGDRYWAFVTGAGSARYDAV
jgi:D-alanyl-D-alanine dipeptidase